MRTIPASTRAEVEKPATPEVLLAFLTITHPNLSVPVRVVSDVIGYTKGGHEFTGLLFEFKLVTDSDEAPTTEISIPNVDRRVGRALEQTRHRAKVALEICSSADFDLTAEPRTEIGTATVLYAFSLFELVDVQADAIQISGRLMLRDYSAEAWPSARATEDRLPGLFR